MNYLLNRMDVEKKVQKLYGVSLVKLGKPSCSHIYDLSDEFLAEKSHTPEARFLSRVKTYFWKLNPLERKILIINLLENGTYYPFWYLPDVSMKEFNALEKSLIVHLICFADDEGVLA